ncbi:hypothetical protein SLE2022_232910 [Rubroshorea leprosula]
MGGKMKPNQNQQQNNNHGGKQQASNEKKNEPIVLKVYMHCQGCSAKVFNSLKCFDGVEEVNIDMANQKVIVKGSKADPLKVLERVRKKYSRNVALLSARPNPNTKAEKKKEPEKKEEPVRQAVFKMYIHCEGCANDVKTNIENMKGILSVQVDMEKSIVVVRGIFDPKKISDMIERRMRKHVEIVQSKQESEQGKGKEKDEKSNEDKKIIHFNYPPQYSSHYIYPCQILSEENIFSCSIM